MTIKDLVAVTGANENRNKPFRTLDWNRFLLDNQSHPSDLIAEMADELLQQKKWREDNHYLLGNVTQGDITLVFYVTVSSDDGGNSAWADVIANIFVVGQGYATTNEYTLMFTEDDGVLQFDFYFRDLFYDEIEEILADEGNFKVLN